MKYKILTCILGILLMIVFTAAVSGERIAEKATVSRTRTIAEDRTTQTTTAVEPEFGSTIVATDGDFPISHAPADARDYSIPWQSVNAGGGDMISTGYQMISSVGQGVIGYATSTSYEHGIGYAYGLTTETSDCDCDTWGSVNGDVAINPVDVVFMVNFVYKNIDQLVPYSNCPRSAGDVNCDGNINPVDVVFFVNFVYKNIKNFCPDPCA